jgi:hypothetical protein
MLAVRSTITDLSKKKKRRLHEKQKPPLRVAFAVTISVLFRSYSGLCQMSYGLSPKTFIQTGMKLLFVLRQMIGLCLH